MRVEANFELKTIVLRKHRRQQLPCNSTLLFYQQKQRQRFSLWDHAQRHRRLPAEWVRCSAARFPLVTPDFRKTTRQRIRIFVGFIPALYEQNFLSRTFFFKKKNNGINRYHHSGVWICIAQNLCVNFRFIVVVPFLIANAKSNPHCHSYYC